MSSTATYLPRMPAFVDTTAACRDVDPDLFHAFDDPPAIAAARAICGTCPLRQACLDYALAVEEPHGIWGGKTAQERSLIVSRRRGPTLMTGAPVPDPEAPFFRYRHSYRNALDAGQAHVDGWTADVAAGKFRVTRERVYAAAAVLRFAPEMEGPVLRGEVSLPEAYRWAQTVRQREKESCAA